MAWGSGGRIKLSAQDGNGKEPRVEGHTRCLARADENKKILREEEEEEEGEEEDEHIE